MGYSYIEGENYLGPGPNIAGSKALIKAIETNGGKAFYPNLYELINTGESDNPQGVKGEAGRLAKLHRTANVKNMLSNLARAAAKADKVITVSH